MVADQQSGWWCPSHRAYIPSEHVTYDEMHDVRFGGCGCKVVDMPKPSHEQMMAGYAAACRFGVLEVRAFDLAEQMWQAMNTAGVDLPDGDPQ
jgi:hypothetical protein